MSPRGGGINILHGIILRTIVSPFFSLILFCSQIANAVLNRKVKFLMSLFFLSSLFFVFLTTLFCLFLLRHLF